MKLNYKSLQLLIAFLALGSFASLQAQLYAGNGGIIYISPGDSMFINENLDIDNGATVIDNSTAGITLTGIATLNGLMEYSASGNQSILPYNHQNLYISGSGNKILTANTGVNGILQLGGTAKLLTRANVLSRPSFLNGPRNDHSDESLLKYSCTIGVIMTGNSAERSLAKA